MGYCFRISFGFLPLGAEHALSDVHRQNSQYQAHPHVRECYAGSAVHHQIVVFQCEGRERGKPPADSHLQKKHRPRIQGLPGRQRRHHTDEERSRNINDKCFYRKTAFRVHIQKSHEISEHRPHEAAGAHYQAFNH